MEEFETLLYHLGQDIGYMGLRVQKDVQKCLKELQTNHDNKKFCEKLTDILKKFSEYTAQYSKDLGDRITEYNQEDDYSEITQKLQEIGAGKKVDCNMCKKKEKGAETSNSLGPPNDKNDDGVVQSEHLTHTQSPNVQNNIVPTNDLRGTGEQHSIQQEPNDVVNSAPSHVDNAIFNTDDEDMSAFNNDDTDIANSLEISHSEEILSNEDQDEKEVVWVCDEGVAPNVGSIGQSGTAESKDGLINDQPISGIEDNSSDKPQKLVAIPLPYKPLFEKEQTGQESTSSDTSPIADSVSASIVERNASLDSTTSDERTESFDSKGVENTASSQNNAKALDSNFNENDTAKKENNMNYMDSNDNDYPDVEIVSIASSHEGSDSDVEIVEDIPLTVNINDQNVIDSTSTAELQGNVAETVRNDSSRSANSADDGIDVCSETVQNPSPRTIDHSKMSLYTGSSEKSVVNVVTSLSQNIDDNNFDAETIKNDHGSFENENVTSDNVEENDGWDTETLPNTSPQINNTVSEVHKDFDQDAVNNSPISDGTTIVNALDSPLAVSLGTDDDVTASEGNYSEETVANFTSPSGGSSNDSDDTTIASPFTAATLNLETGKTAKALKNVESTAKGTEVENEKNERTDPEEDFDAPNQEFPHQQVGCSKKTKNPISDYAKTQDADTVSSSDNLVGATVDKAVETTGESPEEGKEQEAATQVTESTQNETGLEGEDVIMENCDSDMQSQESYIFDLEEQDSEEITRPETNKIVEDDKENDKNNTDSQESLVFDLGKEQEETKDATPDHTSADSTPTVEGLVASSGDKNRRVLERDDENDNLPTSECESGSSRADSDIEGTTIKKTKRKLKENERKSLLKVIAEYFTRRKKEKESIRKSMDESKKELNKDKDTKERRKKRPVKRKGTKEAKKLKTKREKKTSSRNKGEKDSKEYLNFLNRSHIDESSNSSVESTKDIVNTGKDSSDFSDIDTTQIEEFAARKRQSPANIPKENPDKLEKDETGDPQGQGRIEASKSDSEDGNDSEELFNSTNQEPDSTGSSEEPIQSLGDFINQLPIKPSDESSINNKKEDLDEELEDPDLTQKVDNLRKLRHITKNSQESDDIFEEPASHVCIKNSTKSEDEDDNSDSQVERQFKRKVVRPLSVTESDEDVCKEPKSSDTDTDSQVVSPFKKRGVKRLRSSDESDSEPPKKTSDAKDSQDVISLKRLGVKRLLSTDDDESDAAQKSPDNEESEIKRGGPKRKKVQTPPSSEPGSPQDLVTDQNKDKELKRDQNDNVKNQEVSDKNDLDIEESQFKLDDKARDDFLDMFNQDINDSDRLEKDGVSEEAAITERNENIENKDDNETIKASHFKLGNGDRDNLLNMLTDKGNDERNQNNKEQEQNNITKNRNEGDEDNNSQIEPSQFKLNSADRDELLEMFNRERRDDSKGDDGKLNENVKKTQQSDINKNEEDEIKMEPVEFRLNSADRDELLKMLNSGHGSDSKANDEVNKKPENIKKENLKKNNEGIESSEFKLSDKARDYLLDMLSSDQSDNSNDQNVEDDKMAKTLNEKNTDLKKNNDKENRDKDMDVDKVDEGGIGDQDDIDDTATENNREIDESDGDAEEKNAENDVEQTTGKSLQFKLNENEKNELLNLLSNHINRKEKDNDSDTSDADEDIFRKKRKKLKKVDNDMLLELLQEYEDAVKDEVEYGEMEFDYVGDDNEDAKSDFQEDSGSDSVLLDVLREETVEMPAEEGSRQKKFRNGSKEAWNAYQELLKDKDGWDDTYTSSEISDIDIDDLELDFSDQERRQTERTVNAEIKKKFGIVKELCVDVEQTDISAFDLSSLPRKGGNISSKIDRLCDISNVLQKRKKSEKTRRKVKVPRLSPSVRSSISGSSPSDSDSDEVSSSSDHLSDDSVRANQDSTSNRGSPFHLSDDNAEQDKLANALWENIKNSSDENSGWSSDNDDISSDEDKSKKKGGAEGGRKVKRKKKEGKGKEEDDTDSDTSSEKSSDEDDDGVESGDRETKDKDLKVADLDSSDEEDFVGVRKTKGAWKYDPLLKGCLTSDEESDFDSVGSAQKKRISARIKRKMRRILRDSDDSDKKSDSEKDSNYKPTKELENSSDSDVEFVMEKKKTPQKSIVVDDEAEDDSPSKRGKGRRNIRALVEDDELAEATQMAKKEEAERIKRLNEREKAKETFSHSQSFASQLSQDESEPLLLDVDEQLEIKVHPKITKKLKPHQRSGIQFMWDSCYESVKQLKKGYEGSGCILAHCMGLGKTLQALGLIHTVFNYKQVTKMKHVLVVCPLSTVSNWRNEYRLAFRDIRHCNVQLYTIEDKKAAGQRFRIVKNWWKNGGILVMGYECFGLMTNDVKLEKMTKKIFCNKEEVLEALVNPGPDLVICDEGHLLRNKQTQRNIALNKVKTRRRIVLTGTPLQNNLLEYYYMVNFVKPNLLGTEKEFKTNFINPISNGQFEDSTAVDILFMKKRTHVLHKILNKTVQRVEDTELKQYLPELVDQAIFVKLSDLQIQFYNTYLDGANARPVEYTSAGNISRKNFLGDIQVLRYICTHPDVVTIAKRSNKSKIKEQDVIDDNMDEAIEDRFFSKGDWFKNLIPESGVKKLDLGTKMTVTMGIVEEAVASDDKVLIFSQTHAEMDCLEFFLKEELKFKKGTDYNRMDGTISPEVRTHMCDTFNNKNNKRLRVFIMSTKVGGLGLNLTAANRVIIMNVNWNPSYDTQSVFRAFRFGQNKAVYVYRLIAIDTMEEKMYQRQVTKLAVSHRVVDKHQITRHYSAADIQEFYSVRPTIEVERPLPNVPEDRVLAKLIQKFHFMYKWHEHQALLANRPEEDLNEQQKNAAWEEFNKRAIEPPLPGLAPPLPQFMSASGILNQPGPSGIQNINTAYLPYPTTFSPRLPNRRITRLNKMLDPRVRLRAMNTYQPPKTLPVLIKETLSGPKLVVQTHGRILPSRVTSPSMTVSVVDVKTGRRTASVDATRDNEAARKIQAINSLVRAQTTPELIPGYTSRLAVTHKPNTNVSTSRGSASRIDEINSIISASLSQDDAESREWANDGMNATFMNLNVTEEESEDYSAPGLFADHNYSLPKTTPIVTQRTNSADDFRTTQPKYIPRPIFVDVTGPLGPRPNLSGINPASGHKNRLVTTSKLVQAQPPTKPAQTQPTTSSSTQVRLGSAITLTQSTSTSTNPPPAHAQKPSISIIPQPASARGISNSTATKPPPFVPKSLVQNPLNLTKNMPNLNQNLNRHMQGLSPNQIKLIQNLNQTKNIQNLNKTRPSKVEGMFQKAQNQIQNIAGSDLVKSKNKVTSQKNNISHKVVTPPPPRKVVECSPPPLSKILTPPPLKRPLSTSAAATPTSNPLYVPITTSPLTTSTTAASTTTAATSTVTASNQQSPLQKRMRNFMEHLHHLQQSMKDKMSDGNYGQVKNRTVNNQGSSAIPTMGGMNDSNVTNTLPSRTVVRFGPKPLSPVIGGIGITNATKLNAARNLSNITKTYQKAKNNNIVGVTTTTSSKSPSSVSLPNVRVIGTLPASTTGVVQPNNTPSTVTHTNGNSPKLVRNVIARSPQGAPETTVGPANGVRRNSVISHTVGQTNKVPRVITRVVGPNPTRDNAKVNPVSLLNGNVGQNIMNHNAGLRVVSVGGNPNTNGGRTLPKHKKFVMSQKGDVQQNTATAQTSTPIRLDLLQKKMMTNLNKLSMKLLPPKQIPSSSQKSPRQILPSPQRQPSAPQRSFNNGANMKVYESGKPSRASSLPSVSLSQSAASVSKSNKENRTKRKLSLRTNNNASTTDLSSVDLSHDGGGAITSGGSLSNEVVNTLKKKGVSINYLGKGNEKEVINLD